MFNGKYQCHMAASCTYHLLSSANCSTRAIQKSLTLNEKYLRVFWKKVRRMDHQQKNDKTERARGLGRKNKRGDRKGKSNDSPKIPDRRVTDIPSLPSGVPIQNREKKLKTDSIQIQQKVCKTAALTLRDLSF